MHINVRCHYYVVNTIYKWMARFLLKGMYTLLRVLLIQTEFLKNKHGEISYENCPCLSCDAAEGYCLCEPGTWGPRCEHACGECDDPCDFDGTCGCFHGFRNNSACDSKCGHCNGDNTEYCYMNMCYCKDNFYGITCNERCDCDVQNTKMGDTEPQCASNGFCKCKVGAYGKRCDKVCSCPNNGSCYQNGFCGCNDAKWGKSCDKPCNCHEDNSEKSTCDVYGYCNCKPGFNGIRCTEVALDDNTLSTFSPVNNAIYPWVVYVQPSEISNYCLGTIVDPFYIITSSDCYEKTEQINTTIIKTLQNTTYYASEMKFDRGVTGDVKGPILLKIDANRHPNGLELTPTCQPISLPDNTIELDTNVPYLGVGLRYQFKNGFKIYPEIFPSNYTYVTEDECQNDFFRKEVDDMFCAKGLVNFYSHGCSLIKGSPFIATIGGTPYVLGIREDNMYFYCDHPRVYQFINIQRYETWLRENIH